MSAPAPGRPAVPHASARMAAPGWIYDILGPLCGAHGVWNARHARAKASTA